MNSRRITTPGGLLAVFVTASLAGCGGDSGPGASAPVVTAPIQPAPVKLAAVQPPVQPTPAATAPVPSTPTQSIPNPPAPGQSIPYPPAPTPIVAAPPPGQFFPVDPLPSGQFNSGPVSLQFSLTTDKSAYSPGEPIAYSFLITNTGQQTVEYTEGGPSIDIQVLQGSRVVWWLSRAPGYGGGFGGTSGRPIEPGMTFDYAVDHPLTWDQRDIQNKPVPPGQYTLVVWWNAFIDGVPRLRFGVDQAHPGTVATLLGAKPITVTIQ